MSEVSGVVNKVVTTPWQDKVLHGFTLEGDERLFGTGIVQVPTVQSGVQVKFSTEKVKGRWRVNPDTVVIVDVIRQAKPENSVKPKGEYWAIKDRVIELQACRNTAVALVGVLIANNSVVLPTKKADQYDAIKDLVEELTEEFVQANEDIRNPKEEDLDAAPDGPVTEEEAKENIEKGVWD